MVRLVLVIDAALSVQCLANTKVMLFVDKEPLTVRTRYDHASVASKDGIALDTASLMKSEDYGAYSNIQSNFSVPIR